MRATYIARKHRIIPSVSSFASPPARHSRVARPIRPPNRRRPIARGAHIRYPVSRIRPMPSRAHRRVARRVARARRSRVRPRRNSSFRFPHPRFRSYAPHLSVRRVRDDARASRFGRARRRRDRSRRGRALCDHGCVKCVRRTRRCVSCAGCACVTCDARRRVRRRRDRRRARIESSIATDRPTDRASYVTRRPVVRACDLGRVLFESH